ncbi:MAG TPA: class D beta-lactamase [Opitutaceae bacterium]
MIRPIIVAAFLASAGARATEWVVDERLAPPFAQEDLRGVFVLLDREGERFITNDPVRARRPFLPASTFKILNSLIALEERAVADEHEVLAWDGTDHGSSGWNRDHSLESAFKASAVWFYQEMARRVGEERMAHWLRLAEYGNAGIAGGIDLFWLEGALRITAEEQLLFLERLHDGHVPFSQRVQDTVRRVMIAEEKSTHAVRAKTGWALRGEEGPTGWYVGWVERDGRAWFFALNCDLPRERDGRVRIRVARACLKALSVLQPGEHEILPRSN